MTDNTAQARQIGRAIIEWGIDLPDLARDTSRESVEIAIAGFEQAMIPMSKIQLAARQADMQELARHIGMIGVRIRPDFDKSQAENWTAAMVDALDAFPARIAIAAAKDAKHEPMEFPGQVLGVIQAKAERHLADYRIRIRRLKQLLKLIDHPPLLEASDEAKAEAKALSHAELQEMPTHLRSMGLTAGFLHEDPDGSIRWATDDEQEAHREAVNERRIARARE